MEQKNIIELGTKSVPSLLWQYALPSILAMTASSILNIVDRMFIGNGVGALAISGLATTLPFMNLAAAFGAMVGVGAGSIISIRLGQRQYKLANQVLGNTVTLNIVISLAVAVLCLVFLDPMLILFGASENTLPYARAYMQVLLIGNIINHSFLGLNSVLRSGGHPRQAMYCTLLAVVINCVLDPLFIYVFNWGIQGAAWATVISQAAGLVWQLLILGDKTQVLHFERGTYGLRLDIVRQILAIGMSPFFMNVCACIVVLFINKGMRQYGDLLPIENGGDMAIAAYGIDNSVVFFFLMIVMGINQGMQPIAGYNWGAHKNDRVWHVLRLAMMGATCITVMGWIVGTFIPEFVVKRFTNDADVIAIAAHGFRIDVAVFPIVGIQMVISNFFQSIGHAAKSIFLSLSRQLLFLLPGLYFLPQWMGFDGVWWAIPISDAISFLFAVGMLLWLIHHIKKHDEANRTA